MEAVQRIMLAIVGVAMVTTLILPRRQTVPTIGAVDKLFRGGLATAMGSGSAARVP